MQRTSQDYENGIRKLAKGLRDFCGERQAVIGISGGVDSALAAGIAKIGGVSMRMLHLPMGDSSPYAEVVRKALEGSGAASGMSVVRITPIVNMVVEATATGAGLRPPSDVLDKLVVGNIAARVRMTILYAVSNICKGIVVGTSNKSERWLGYGTKHGDMACDVNPLGELLKRDVVEMARIIGVPKEILARAPSAELWDGQTDEGELGKTYKVIDGMIDNLEGGVSLEAAGNLAGGTASDLSWLFGMAAASAHKRTQPVILNPW